MKKITLALVFLLILPCILTACGAKQPLYSVSQDHRVYEIRRNGKRTTITVTENGISVWEITVKAKRSAWDAYGTNGLEVLDLNFDGLSDLKIALSEEDEKITEVCYLQDPVTGLYEKSEALAQLYTVGVVEDQKLILSYTGISADRATGVTEESIVAYQWQGDSLIPYRRVSITYYPAQDRYCYGVSDYIDGSFQFDDPNERWLTPKEYAETDWSFFYYFR